MKDVSLRSDFLSRNWNSTLALGRRIAVPLFLVACLALPVGGQQQNAGSIVGTVKDPGGLAVPDADVVAMEQSTGVSSATKTNRSGGYTLLNLPVGQYRLTINKSGFNSSAVEELRLVAGQTLSLNIDLVMGAVTQTVTVSTTSARIDTINSDMGTTMSTEELTAVPLEMAGGPRAALSFLTTTSGINTVPKVSSSNPTNQPSGFANSSIQGSSAYGGNQNNVGYTIDGTSATYRMFTTVADFASVLPEAIEEVRLASNFNADQGWDGGTEVALVTKSGTNHFHGGLFEYVQNEDLDARNYFAAQASGDHQNEFGGLVGGPIRRDKTFFFGTLDFFRFRTTPQGISATVPTALMQTGNFTQVLGAQAGTDALGRPVYANEIYDPTTTRTLANGTIVRDPYMCKGVLNVMCPSAFSKVSSYFAAGFPAPTLPGTQNNWIGAAAPSPLNIVKFSIKIDQQFGKRFRLTGGLDAAPSYNQVTGSTNFGPILTTSQYQPDIEYRPRVVFTGTLRPDLLFSVNFGANYVRTQLNMNGEAAATAGQSAGLKGVFTPNLPIVTIANTTGFGTPYLNYVNPQYTLPNISGYFAWLKGSHSIKWGADYMRAVIGQPINQRYTAGQFAFSQLSTGLPNFSTTGWGYASFLEGAVNTGVLYTPAVLKEGGEGWDAYVQDQWRVVPKLTLNYGIRWSASLGPWEANNRFGAFDPTVPNPAAGNLPGAISFWGTGSGDNGHTYLWKPSLALFDPRVGLAYAFSQNMVVRAYYGIINIPAFSNLNSGSVAPSYGYTAQSTVTTVDNGVTPAFNWDSGYPNAPVVPSTNPSFLNGSAVAEVDYNHNETGRTQTWGLSVERTLPWGLTAKGEYVAKMTHGLMLVNSIFYGPYNVGGFPSNQLPLQYLSLGSVLQANINSPQAKAAGIVAPYPGFTGSVAQALLPFPQYTYVGQENNTGGFSEYNSGHFSVQKRYGSGLSTLVDYTFSKQLVSGYFQDTLVNQRKMMSPVDIPWNLAVSYSYDLPIGPKKRFLNSGVTSHILGDWNVSGIQNYQAGSVITVSTQASIPGITYLEAQRVPGVAIRTSTSCANYNPHAVDPYLNVNAFSSPAPYTLGNVYELNSVRNCGFYNENIAISKIFRIGESKNFKLSGNFFNAFNRHMFSGLGTNVNNASTFGTYSSATSPRSIQLMGRLTF